MAKYSEVVEPEYCERCIEMEHDANMARQKSDIDWQAAKTRFIQNMREVPRDQEWKQGVIDKILPQN